VVAVRRRADFMPSAPLTNTRLIASEAAEPPFRRCSA
jgi:hypothetical protein